MYPCFLYLRTYITTLSCILILSDLQDSNLTDMVIHIYCKNFKYKLQRSEVKKFLGVSNQAHTKEEINNKCSFELLLTNICTGIIINILKKFTHKLFFNKCCMQFFLFSETPLPHKLKLQIIQRNVYTFVALWILKLYQLFTFKLL